MANLKIVEWMPSPRATKKYRVRLSDGRLVDFGSSSHQHYRDVTPLRLWSSKDHLDVRRRSLYYTRHNIDYEPFSADWLSKRYLWPLK